MKDETIEAWDAICRRATSHSVNECRPQMVSASDVSAALFELLKEFGGRAADDRVLLDADSEEMIRIAFSSACEHNTFAAFNLFTPMMKDTAKEFATMAFISITLLAEAEMEYGPVPAGLRGRDLAFAALALEILETRSPQRLLAERQPKLH